MSKHKHGDGGKLSARRDSANSNYIDSIRWELIKSTTPPERKEEIKRELEILKFGDCVCHHCGEICKVVFDKTVNSFVSDCHGVGFDYETQLGDINSVGSDLRYIEDWNE